MSSKLLNFKMQDGSRNFAEFPETVSFVELRNHAAKLKGAKVKGFLTDYVTEVWLDFEFCKQKISVNNQLGNFWFFVKNANCTDDILLEVYEHFRILLEK